MINCNFCIGLAETYKAQPNNPVDFFAKWLLNYNLGAIKESQHNDTMKKAEENRKKYAEEHKHIQIEQAQKAQVEENKEKSIEDFKLKIRSLCSPQEQIAKSEDLEDHLQELSDFLAVSQSCISHLCL